MTHLLSHKIPNILLLVYFYPSMDLNDTEDNAVMLYFYTLFQDCPLHRDEVTVTLPSSLWKQLLVIYGGSFQFELQVQLKLK